jgi:hypothetical protein
LSRITVERARTNAIVVEICRSPVSFRRASNAGSGGTSIEGASERRAGRLPPRRSRDSRSRRISGLSARGR